MENKKAKNNIFNAVTPILFPLLALVVALLVSVFFVMWAKSYSILQFFDGFNDLISTVWKGSFGSEMSTMNTIFYTTPLIFTGIANAVAFKTGLFNIGTEGQFIIGMITAAVVGQITGLPAIIHLPLVFICGILLGGIWSAIPGYIKAKTGTSEVINTIMMNYIALYLTDYIIRRTPLGIAKKASTPMISESARLFRFVDKYQANVGIIIGIVVAIFIAWLLWKTVVGYELRSVGMNRFGAEYGGINVKKNIVLAMTLSGVIAALGGVIHVTGGKFYMDDMTNLPGYGFTGMAVALLAKSNPIGCLFSALLFGALNSSAKTLQLNGIPKEIVSLIQGVIIIFIATDYIVKYIIDKKKKEAMIHE